MSDVEIYCDGACSGNPGPGGWGAMLIWQDKIKEISGFNKYTTNNKMEMTAAIMALRSIKKYNTVIKLYTDSVYLKNGMTIWLAKWQKNNWNKGKVKNVDLWQELDLLAKNFSVEWNWIKGHNGNIYNERADQLATNAIKNNR